MMLYEANRYSPVTLSYLSEYAEDALLALALAKKEAEHLSYTHRTLFAQSIDLDWVESLPDQPALAKKKDLTLSFVWVD
jgi:hypothetical protein